MEKIIELGIDEAGRGPVLGPLVLAGVSLPKEQESLLREWGIDDSKRFGSQKKGKMMRQALAEKIKARFPYKILVFSPQEIDQYIREKSLNRLEQEGAKIILDELPADQVVLDGENLFKPLAGKNILATNKADATYMSVAAASILAKTTRDDIFEELCQPFAELYGEIRGGGYPNKQTLHFVLWHHQEYGELPDFYRKSYKWKQLQASF
ncbi:MAG: hypothetical protein COB67_03030 [SAR324 cluster bacterium]|uniref:Ribonuclease n=1 Tax=SAR324 cluster bacterium TaxID=2024889 RepID=A0A2A4T9C0_9DELT|nr:MAG: hypothetical protein COB67_03030 [SAR324 cluster bacterium]